MKLNKYVCGAARQFSLWFAKGTIGNPILKDIDYIEFLKEESSFVEQAFAIFMNNLEIDEEGGICNYKYCENRAAQYIRSYFDKDYIVTPPFGSWKCELHPVSKDFYMK